MVAEFDRRRKVVVEGLNQLPGISCATPKGAFYAFPNIKRTGWKAKPLASALLEDAGVAIIGGPDFGMLGEGYIRAVLRQLDGEYPEGARPHGRVSGEPQGGVSGRMRAIAGRVLPPGSHGSERLGCAAQRFFTYRCEDGTELTVAYLRFIRLSAARLRSTARRSCSAAALGRRRPLARDQLDQGPSALRAGKTPLQLPASHCAASRDTDTPP